MPIYKQDASGKFVPFEKTPFPDLEKTLEDWIEANPHLVLDGEDLAIVARQPRTGFDKYLDLLAIDKTGATVIIELKRGETPRDVVAQALEYAAWIDSLSFDQLDEMARDYAKRGNLEANGIADLYERAFVMADAPDGDDGGRPADTITFNNRQRVVIVAEHIADEVEQTLRYLRTRLGAEVYGVEFSVHRAADETIITTTTVVGREHVSKPAQTWVPREHETDDAILARVKSDFVKDAINGVEDWVAGAGIDGLTVDHSTGSDHFIRYSGATWLYYYYAANWLYMQLYNASEAEVTTLRQQLSKPAEVLTRDGWNAWRFHVATPADFEVVQEVVLARVSARRSQPPSAGSGR